MNKSVFQSVNHLTHKMIHWIKLWSSESFHNRDRLLFYVDHGISVFHDQDSLLSCIVDLVQNSLLSNWVGEWFQSWLRFTPLSVIGSVFESENHFLTKIQSSASDIDVYVSKTFQLWPSFTPLLINRSEFESVNPESMFKSLNHSATDIHSSRHSPQWILSIMTKWIVSWPRFNPLSLCSFD